MDTLRTAEKNGGRMESRIGLVTDDVESMHWLLDVRFGEDFAVLKTDGPAGLKRAVKDSSHLH